MPYLAGLLGIYCQKGHHPLNGTRRSSTVTWGPGLYKTGKISTHLSHTSLIAASLSLSRRPALVLRKIHMSFRVNWLQRHCCSKYWPSTLFIPQTGSCFSLWLVHSSLPGFQCMHASQSDPVASISLEIHPSPAGADLPGWHRVANATLKESLATPVGSNEIKWCQSGKSLICLEKEWRKAREPGVARKGDNEEERGQNGLTIYQEMKL